MLSERESQSASVYLSSFVRSHDAQSLWRSASNQVSISFQEAANLRAELVDLFPQVAQWQVSGQAKDATPLGY